MEEEREVCVWVEGGEDGVCVRGHCWLINENDGFFYLKISLSGSGGCN